MTLKIKLWFNGKKEKKNWCAHDKKLFLFILSQRPAVLSRGTQRNRRTLSECSNPLQISWFSIVSTWSDISDQVGHFHWVPEAWQLCQVRHIWPQVRYIRPTGYIRSSSGSRALVTKPGRTYLTHRIYPVFIGFQNRVTSPWSDISEPHQIYPTQPNSSQFESPIGHIWSRSDISDVLTPPTVINAWGAI
jgi:hypothetical protein